MTTRDERVREAIREAAAEFLVREAGPQSLITVTRVMLSGDNGTATVYLSVLPESAEEQALSFANRNRGELALFLKNRTRGIRTPHLEFVIDLGEKNRQRLDDLSN